MTCAEFKELVDAFALGSLDPAERAAAEAHLQQREHDGCLAALRRATDAAALVGLALPPVTPSPSTWDAIVSRTAAAAAPKPRRASLVPWAFAAMAAVLVAWLLRDRFVMREELRAQQDHVQSQASERAQCLADLQKMQADAKLQREALALLSQPNARVVALAASGGAATNANVILRPGDNHAYLVGRNLAAPAGRDYELWVIRGARKIPAGLLRGDASGAVVTALDPALLRDGLPDALAVTLEPSGGGDAPQGPIVAVGKI